VTLNLVYANYFTQPLEPGWVIYKGVPTCCPQTQWDKGQVVVANDLLTIKNTRQTDGAFLSGGLSMAQILSQAYGRWRVRFRFEPGTGVKMCLLLWQTAPNPAAPDHAYELDFAEGGGADELRGMMTATLHYPPGNEIIQARQVGDFTQWHTMGVTWTPKGLEYTLDSRVWAQLHNPPLPEIPMHLAMQTTTGTPIATWAGTPDEVDLQIDWVKVWSYTP
jgi:beta-glucanase (GH16 family)